MDLYMLFCKMTRVFENQDFLNIDRAASFYSGTQLIGDKNVE